LELRQKEAFRRWRLRLRDDRARALIASRLDRLAYGHAGDAPVLLLQCAGDKSSQARDIRMAKQLLADWRK
jgi:putative component of toxin-antitoxin plasmid stabilization module